MRRWVCPACGSGKRAPERARMDDTRRYCLRCSSKTGRLVARVCQAAEKRRATKATRAAAKATTLRERTREQDAARFTAAGVDCRAEARVLAMLFPTLRARGGVAKLVVRRSKVRKRGESSGHAYWNARRIVVTLVGDADRAEVCALLAHEVAHLAAGYRDHHNATWVSLFREAVARGYGVDAWTVSALNKLNFHVGVEAALRAKFAAPGEAQS